MGQAYDTIANLASRAVIKKTVSVHIKKWWHKELTTQKRQLRQAAPQDYQQEARTLQKMITTSKHKCWQKFLEEQGHRHHWQIVAINKDPFHMIQRKGDLTSPEGRWLTQDQEKVQALVSHNFITDVNYRAPLTIVTSPTRYAECNQQEIHNTLQALQTTKNSSAAGPDGISHRLIQMLKGSNIVKAVINDICRCTPSMPSISITSVPYTWTDMKVVIIPKPNKDHSEVKGWCPIVLSNTCGKLVENQVAKMQQKNTSLFNHLQYGSRTGRSAMDSLMLIVGEAERAFKSGLQVTLLGRVILSAVNQVKKEVVYTILRDNSMQDLTEFVQNFLRPRTFTIQWDSTIRGTGSMTNGTLPGSPLSPVLWLIYIASTLKRIDVWILESQGLRPPLRNPN